MTNEMYLESHQNLRNVIDHYSKNLTVHSALITYALDKNGLSSPDDAQQKFASSKAKETYEAIEFFSGLNKKRYQDLLNRLANAFLVGRDE